MEWTVAIRVKLRARSCGLLHEKEQQRICMHLDFVGAATRRTVFRFLCECDIKCHASEIFFGTIPRTATYPPSRIAYPLASGTFGVRSGIA